MPPNCCWYGVSDKYILNASNWWQQFKKKKKNKNEPTLVTSKRKRKKGFYESETTPFDDKIILPTHTGILDLYITSLSSLFFYLHIVHSFKF